MTLHFFRSWLFGVFSVFLALSNSAIGNGFGASPASDSNVRYLVIRGEVNERQNADIRSKLLDLGFEATDIDRVREALESLKWVASAEVTFNWPDELIVRVEPEQAIAYWNDSAFINQEGSVFYSDFHGGLDLPYLSGPEKDLDEVMRRYLEIRRAMPGRALEEVEIRARGALAFELEEGWRVLLGSHDISQRLKRAVIVINRLEQMGIPPNGTKIDARYTDGVAINELIPTTDQLLTQSQNTRKGEEL
jgi:cell division septal protein FtsQ